jgi:hypothetical protein
MSFCVYPLAWPLRGGSGSRAKHLCQRLGCGITKPGCIRRHWAGSCRPTRSGIRTGSTGMTMSTAIRLIGGTRRGCVARGRAFMATMLSVASWPTDMSVSKGEIIQKGRILRQLQLSSKRLTNFCSPRSSAKLCRTRPQGKVDGGIEKRSRHRSL